jgi:uncharacterized C2H2 Zn-finger protein
MEESKLTCPFCTAVMQEREGDSEPQDGKESIPGTDYLECPRCNYQEEDNNTSKAA